MAGHLQDMHVAALSLTTPWGALHKISSLNWFQTKDTDGSQGIMSNAKKVTIITCQQDNTPQMSTQFQTLTDWVYVVPWTHL
jgi:hypothetical protein